MKHWIAIVTLGIVALATPSQAAIIFGGDSGHTTAPAEDPGWDRVGKCGSNGSGVYMGNGWVLTANHVGSKTTFVVGSETYTAIAATETGQVGSADLYLFRVGVESGDGLYGLGMISMVSSTPTEGTDTIHIGTGVGQTSDATAANYWRNGQNWNTSGSGAPYVGYTWSGTRATRWDEQTISDDLCDPDQFTTSFENEDGFGMVADNDSGSALFVLDGTTWKLAGIAVEVGLAGASTLPATNTFVTPDPSGSGSIHGFSVYEDVATYASTIQTVIETPEPATLSLLACGAVAILKRRRKR